uniref:polynucleotide adenylyltransferase n=1 Tax=Meloidogyne enterolobii TaxID=390850 RepID=A0A6V7VCK4_MELEN|nr:unnamed protein product [Meloidogyne enterolobii]
MLEKNKWEIFSDLMRAVKHWAKQKGLYSNVFGYLSGTALILMTAKICLIYQSASLTFLVQRFFQIYSLWEWPVPIILEQLTMPSDLPQLSNNDFIKSWNLLNLRNDYMPIISPIFPEQNTAFNTNEFTRDIIVKEMKKAYAQLDRSTSLLTEKFYKDILFKKLEYKKQYEHFLVLVCSEKIKIEDINENKSCEFVKTKVRGLLVRWAKKATLRFKIEENTAENVEEENYKIYKLSDYLEEYHALTNLEWKCNDGDNKRLTIWLVGINFKKGNFENRKIEKEKILLLIPSFNFFTNYVITENYKLEGIHITRRNIGELDSLIEDGTISCPKIEDIESKEKTNEKWKEIQGRWIAPTKLFPKSGIMLLCRCIPGRY